MMESEVKDDPSGSSEPVLDTENDATSGSLEAVCDTVALNIGSIEHSSDKQNQQDTLPVSNSTDDKQTLPDDGQKCDKAVEVLPGSSSQTTEMSPSLPSMPQVQDWEEWNKMYFPGLKTTDDEVIDNLTYSVLAEYLPQLQKSKSTLSEVTENQRILIETVQQENAKFGECLAMDEVSSLMNKARLYHTKLQNIRKDMAFLHEKSGKLKKRSLKLQQQKQKEALQQEQDRERELEKERLLIAKPVKKRR